MFEIAFESAGGAKTTESETDGTIAIGDHWERFTASHTVWDRSRYERQWREAADRVLAGKPGCFVIDDDGEHEEPAAIGRAGRIASARRTADANARKPSRSPPISTSV
jgi:hypothetical protein